MNTHPAIQCGDLHKDSYTAHRLHHGTSNHLHVTSRRIFVGPIPVDWIKANRKDWYKPSVHGFYSKRTATFGPVEVTTGHRHVSNLPAISEAAEGGSSSSWQDASSGNTTPTSRQSIGELVVLSEEEQVGSPSTDPGILRPELERIKSAPEAPHPLRLKPRSAETWHPSMRAQSLASPRPRLFSPPSSWLGSRGRQDSFATAQESWGGEESLYTPDEGEARLEDVPEGIMADVLTEEPGDLTEVPGNSREPPTGLSEMLTQEPAEERLEDAPDGIVANVLTEEPRDLMEEPGDLRELPAGLADMLTQEPAAMNGNSEAGTSDSRQGLLEREGADDAAETSESQTAPAENQGESGNRPQKRHSVSWGLGKRKSTTSDRAAPRASTNLERVSGGLVRFNTQVDSKERDKKKQQKLAELSRTRRARIAARRHHHTRKREGEIIKMDSMLVRVEMAHSHTLPNEYDENESRTITTRLVDKWREYVVVCREGADENTPMTLNLYKSRVIPAIDKPHVSTRAARKIPLNLKTKVNIYSSLDKTLVIWLPNKYGTLIYIMRPRCSSTSVEWYTFLQHSLGEGRPQSLQIAVPDLSLSLLINNPFGRMEDSLESENENSIVEEERAVAANLLRQSMSMLEGVPEWADITDYWKKHEKMGLAWRRYDRLEWIHGANEQRMYGSIAMAKTHELELRPKCHYPTETMMSTGIKIPEPVPIEGFLIRLTSGKGRQERLGRLFQKRLYFTTHDNYLCFCRPSRALPPRPLNPKLCRDGSVPSADEIADELPLIYSVTPFPLNAGGDVEWLNGNTPENVEQKDKEAYEEAERKVNTLLNTEGFIDLCKVLEVRARTSGEHEDPASSDDAIPRASEDRIFELVLENGLILPLKSWDKQTRDEWVLRLRDLVVYWKARDIADLAIVRRTRAENLAQLNVDEEMESVLGQYARKWEVSRTRASPELYNVCGLSSCRAITLSGVLYRKPSRHSTFRRYGVVLSHGQLMVFRYSHRDHAGKAVQTVYQEHQVSISLRDCYIYSGLVTGSDLLYSGQHALPRIYPDGYTSQDEDTMTCFVVWHGTRRSKFTRTDEDGKVVKQNLAQLGKTGKANVFKARSRLERDQWVMSISMEIERLNTGAAEEIKVEGGGVGGS